MPAKGVRSVVFYVLIKSEHIASYQHEILTKDEFPAPASAYPVRNALTKKGPDPSLLKDPEMKALTELVASTMDEPTGPPQRPARVWEEHEHNGHLPKLPDCPVCVEEQGTIVKHAPNATPRLHTLHLDTGCWDDMSVDGKKYFFVAGIRPIVARQLSSWQQSTTHFCCWFFPGGLQERRELLIRFEYRFREVKPDLFSSCQRML